MIRETSIEAYQKLKDSGQLSKRRWEVYSIVWHRGPLTARQVFELVPGGRYKSHTAGRLSELAQMGVLKEIGTAPCPITGNTVIVYDVTSADSARPLTRRETKTERIRFLEVRVRELEAQLGQRTYQQMELL